LGDARAIKTLMCWPRRKSMASTPPACRRSAPDKPRMTSALQCRSFWQSRTTSLCQNCDREITTSMFSPQREVCRRQRNRRSRRPKSCSSRFKSSKRHLLLPTPDPFPAPIAADSFAFFCPPEKTPGGRSPRSSRRRLNNVQLEALTSNRPARHRHVLRNAGASVMYLNLPPPSIAHCLHGVLTCGSDDGTSLDQRHESDGRSIRY